MPRRTPRRDAIDIELRQNVIDNPGCSIAEAIEPLIIERSESVLRSRIRDMVRFGQIRMERERYEAKLYNVDADGKGDAL